MFTLRHLAERLSRGIVLRRRFPASLGGGTLHVSPEAGGLRYWRPGLQHVDPLLLRLAREHVRPGAVVWDIGANVGLFTFAAAHLAGPSGYVLAVEADADCVRLLCLSRGAQYGRKPASALVDVVCAAVSDSPGDVTFEVAARSRASNSIAGYGQSQTGGVRERRTVTGVTLEGLAAVRREPDLIKIDVEGAELRVLEGGRELLQRCRPTLLLEVNSGVADRVTALLRDLGYELTDGITGQPTERATWSTVAVPRAKAGAAQ